MRPIRLMSLVILSWLVSGAWGSAKGLPKIIRPVPPERAGRQAAGQPKEAKPIFSLPVEGWGNTREDAWQRALENAWLELPRYLALEWRPSRDYIWEKLVKTEPEDLRAEDFGEPVGWAQGVRLRIDIAPKDWQDMLRQDQRVRSESRMLLLAKLLIGLVAFLGAVAGYLRLEEMTKGYYTAWLRLAAVGFLTAVGAGIWWIS